MWREHGITKEEHTQLLGVYEVIFNKIKVALKDRPTGSVEFILDEISVLIDIYKYIDFPRASQSVVGSVDSLIEYVFSCDRLDICLFH